MPAAGKADVVVAAAQVTPSVVNCIRRVLEIRDTALGGLIVVAAADPRLESLAQSAPNVRLVREGDPLVAISSWNRGVLERTGDVVLLPADAIVTTGWLSELLDVAHSEERVAFACPLMNVELTQTHAEWPAPATNIDSNAARYTLAGLPRSTTTPIATGACVYLRGRAVDAIGSLNTSFSTLHCAVEDWLMRAKHSATSASARIMPTCKTRLHPARRRSAASSPRATWHYLTSCIPIAPTRSLNSRRVSTAA